MPTRDKACLVWLGGVFLLTVISFFPAPNPLFWALRVGVPELSWLLILLCLPPLLLLARKSPLVAAGLAVVVLTPLLLPWLLAGHVQWDLPRSFERALLVEPPKRSPLVLGSTTGVAISTAEYKPGLKWDRYAPESGQVRARLLFVHGGSWRNGTRGDYPQLFSYLAGRGFEVYSLTYRLAPHHPYPAGKDDVVEALEQLSGDTPLFVAGRSSGGHLALLAAYTRPDLVSGVIGLYPPVDMVWSYQHPSNPEVLDSGQALREFLGGTPEELPAVYQEASPLHRVDSGTPPTLLIHGARDTLVYLKQSQMLIAALRQNGVKHFLLELPWTEHGGDVTIYGPTGRLTCWTIEAFLESLLSPESSS